MKIEGILDIKLTHRQARVQSVEIRSQRPVQAASVFQGKVVTGVLQTLPLLYQVCSMAQATAAITACEQALGMAQSSAIQTARLMLVQLETAREHAWRILLDWPEQASAENKSHLAQLHRLVQDMNKALFGRSDGFGLAPQAQFDFEAIQAVIEKLSGLLEQTIFAIPLAQWLELKDATALFSWIESTSLSTLDLLREQSLRLNQARLDAQICYLPNLDSETIQQRFTAEDADTFIALPQWAGKCCETGALARLHTQGLISQLLSKYGAGIFTRSVARLFELAAVPARLTEAMQSLATGNGFKSNAVTGPDGVGLAQVEAARGRLLHRVELNGLQVVRYQILAPTEWNFHPRGVAAELLGWLEAATESELLKQAHQLILAIDPCVRYQLHVIAE